MNVRLPLKVKICYSIGSMGKVVQGLAGSMFLLYFYTEVIGLNPGLSGSIIFFSKLFDIVNDPFIGALVDCNASTEGKCRIFLKRFSIPTGICLSLCFFMPFENTSAKIAWVILTYGVLATVSSFIQIPMNTLMGRLSCDEQQRAHLNQLSGIISLIGNFIVVSWTLPFAAYWGHGSLKHGFLCAGICYGIIYALSYMIAFWGTKGYECVEKPTSEAAKKSLSLSVTVKGLLSNKIWFCIGFYYLFDMIATTLESTAMVFYFQYNLKNTGLLSAYSAVTMICNFVIYTCFHKFTRRLGNAGTTVLGCCLSITGDTLRFLLHDANLAVMVTGWILSGFGACLVAGTVLLNLFDAQVYGEWKNGTRSDAVLMSGFTLATKIGMAVGSAAIGWLLMLVPYTEGAARQPEPVLKLFFGLNTVLPAVTFFLVLLLALPVQKNEKKLSEMKKDLSERKRYETI